MRLEALLGRRKGFIFGLGLHWLIYATLLALVGFGVWALLTQQAGPFNVNNQTAITKPLICRTFQFLC